MKIDRDKLASAVKSRRGDRSQAQIAAEIGISQNTVYRIESGYGTPDGDTLAKLFAWLGQPFEDFVTETSAAAA